MLRHSSIMRYACALVGPVVFQVTYRQSFLRKSLLIASLAAAILVFIGGIARSQITNNQTGQVIPGTEGITPGLGVDLSGWNAPGHQLEYASLVSINLTTASFANSDIANADFHYSTLTGANFSGANITGGKLCKHHWPYVGPTL